MINLEKLLQNREKVKNDQPLIHAITNPLAINMVANAILFQHAKAICAEHPEEMGDIVPISKALSLNLGNITDARIKSIELSSKLANENNIASIIDLVGIGASKLRYDFSQKLLKNYKYDIIKGNSSEILALSEKGSNAKGIDVGEKDKISSENIKEMVKIASNLSQKYQSTVLITGAFDILVKDKTYYIIENGCEELSQITATGCMLTGLISVFLSVTDSISASLLGLLILEISAEMAKKDKPYSFFVSLMDNIGTIENESIKKHAKIKKGVL